MKLKFRPLLALPLVLVLFFAACTREVSLETGYTSVYALQDTFGTCYTSTVVGTFRAGQALGDTNYLQLQLHVAVPGRYSIHTDLQNGFSFTGTGNFNDTGMTTIRIPARGTPTTEGITTLRLAEDSSYCEINVTVLGAGPVNGGGTCNAAVAGSFKKDTALTAANTVTVQHNYATAGTYTISTDTINGYYFNKTITVAAAGNQTATLDGFGTPAATGTNNFTVRFGDGTTCGFPITVVQGGTGGGGSTGCGTANGTYTAGTAVTSSNTVTGQHSYATTGTFTINTTTVNGVSFSGTATAATAGAATSYTLTATGTPTAAGSFTYSLNFGDGATCTFTLTVNPAGVTGGNYFPLTVNSWWSYNDPLGSAGDTLTRRNDYSTTFNSLSYRGFTEYNNINNPEDTFYYRKDASGTTYNSIDLNDYMFAFNITFPAGARGDLPIVKDVLATGDVWYSNAYTGNSGGNSIQIRVKFTCVGAAETVTANSRTFTNVYEVHAVLQSNQGFGWTDFPFSGDLGTQWFAPNVGLIKESHPFPTTPMELRNYQVN